jgi:hypothetical protein
VVVALDRSLRDPSLFVPVFEDACKSKVSYCSILMHYMILRRGNERSKACVISVCSVQCVVCRVWCVGCGVQCVGCNVQCAVYIV